MTQAQGAIGVIAKALFTGQTAPAAARDQVAGNLTAANTALGALSSCVPLLVSSPAAAGAGADVAHLCCTPHAARRTDETVSGLITKANSQLAAGAKAGEGVVSNCS